MTGLVEGAGTISPEPGAARGAECGVGGDALWPELACFSRWTNRLSEMTIDSAIRQQVLKLLVRRDLRQACEFVAQVGERIDPQSLVGGNERAEHRRRLA